MVQNKKSYNLVIGVLALLTIILLIAVIGYFVSRPRPLVIQGEAEATEYRVSGKVPGRIETLFVKDGQEHVPDGSRDREVHPVVHQQDDTEPKCREQNGIDKHLAENCNAHGIAGCHQQMTGSSIFQLCAERVNHDDDYCQCQYTREEDVCQVVTIVSILVTNLMYIYIHGSDPSHDRILVHAFRAEHLSLDSAVREVYHRQNIFI